MKDLKQLTIVLFLPFILASCGNDAKKLTTEIEETTQTVKNEKNISKDVSAMQKNIEKLREMEPLTKEQFQSWLPETILDLPLTSSQINFMPGLSSCAGNYRVGNTRIRIMVIDGAGEKGAGGVGPYRMSSKMDYDTEDQWGYTQSRIIDGVKVKESYRESGKSYNISMFYAERFAVDIETHNLDQNVLDKIIEELNLSELKNL